jgi:sialidase-1
MPLHDGRLFFAYSGFYGGARDSSPAHICSRLSSDLGMTWTEPSVIVANEGQMNVMSVSLLRLPSDEVLLFYLRKNSQDDCRVFVRRSVDDAGAWSAASSVTADIAYHVMNNDRVVRLSSGRLLAPTALTVSPEPGPGRHQVSLCQISDDDGHTWRKGKGHTGAPGRGALEPGVVELSDGRVLMIIRTDQGRIYTADSHDEGDTWSEAASTDLRSPCSPATIRRLPQSGELLLIWNDNYDPAHKAQGLRTPLTTAISQDEGRTWRNRKQLETEPDWGYCYTSVLFVQGRCHLTYCAAPYSQGILTETRLTILDEEWFRT